MKVSLSLLKRSTYVYISIIVYLCAFLLFVYQGYKMGCSDILECNSVSSTNARLGVVQEFTFEGILQNNEMCIVKNYIGVITVGIFPLIALLVNASFFGMMIGMAIYKKVYFLC